MKQDWLKQRLTAAKQAAPMWSEFAEAVQEVFEQQIEPLMSRLRGLSSAYTMTSDDLALRIAELGQFFILSERVEKADWPLALMQRHDEIHLKKTDYPLVSTLSREFGGMKVSWEPLYAPKDQALYPYGTRFSIKSQLENETIPVDEWFLTSRGVIRLPLTALQSSFAGALTVDEQATAFEEVMTRFIEPLIPLHIVFEGAQYYLQYVLPELDEAIRLLLIESGETFPPALESRDRITTTSQSSQIMPPANNAVPYKYSQRARLDVQPLDSWTLDRPIPGST
ncbi:hypothetical protein [Aeromonas salmonicida]|uniref:hypothetical protein n=1 Tax=Aeromonas salmonicida TaxID=645 RepID=UPI00232F05A6|nr:hypothetical protein [Aeromonas salmonicida]WCH25174.1 hypothetical protein ONZ54_23190 [Aeromonas salmonicida]